MRYKWLIGIVILMVLMAATACREGGMETIGAPERGASDFSITLDDAALFNGATVSDVYLTTEDYDTHTLVSVNVRGANGLKAFYGAIEYDASAYKPMIVEPTAALGNTSDLIELTIADTPGEVHYGVALKNPDWHTGASGNLTVAQVSFRKEAFDRNISAPPNTAASQTTCSWDAVNSIVSWYYFNVGDYNQDNVISLADITPVAQNFNQSVPETGGELDLTTALSVVDGSGDGVISLADITPIAQNFQRNCSSYNVYESPTTDDVADGMAATPAGATLLGNVPHGDMIRDDSANRGHFEYTVAAPTANAYFWVRPVDGDGAEGFASLPVQNVAAADQPLLSINNPPGTGSGTAGDPYIANVSTVYTFSLNHPVDGDVTADANFAVSNTAGTWGGADGNELTIDNTKTPPFDFAITATYDSVANRSDTTVYMRVPAEPPAELHIMIDESGTPNPWDGIAGDGSEGDPYVVSSSTFNSDFTTVFQLMANTASDGSGDDITGDVEWDAMPPFIVEDPAWPTAGEFQPMFEETNPGEFMSFCNGYIFALQDTDESNHLYVVALDALP